MNKDPERIKAYWDGRAAQDSSAQSTTMDVWLRHIEANFVSQMVRSHDAQIIHDVGCGDGLTTLHCAREHPDKKFHGTDFSPSMIENARANLTMQALHNVTFDIGDATDGGAHSGIDLAYSTRCLINLSDWDAQISAIRNIHDSLVCDGLYLMIENFVEGHNAFNALRLAFNLPEIAVRHHNTFFNRQQLLESTAPLFEIVEEQNISSTYYMVSRLVYSKICADSGAKPDYFDKHHQLGAELPFAGEYGPVRAVLFRKK
jgi:SAM-dependent methyltransferase